MNGSYNVSLICLYFFSSFEMVLDLVALTNDVEGSDTEEQDASGSVPIDVRNPGESDALIDARTSRMLLSFYYNFHSSNIMFLINYFL